ncbi:MAG: orotate phosphoribosyltransferase [Bacillaceae bacterium]|nr:orotate phosphoribosyltransferase [Bacillaceae bacterium]
MLTRDELLNIFKETGVLKEGHFLLTSGRHSAKYMQCAQLLQYPDKAEKVCRDLAEAFQDQNIETVVGPAMGGVIVAYETARQLGVKSIFTERENGKMTLRRGFNIEPGTRVLIVEDVVTTGGSVKEVIEVVEQAGGEIVGVAVMVDRSNGNVDFGYPLHALLPIEIETYLPEDCPLCKEGASPAEKPGSRNIAKS